MLVRVLVPLAVVLLLPACKSEAIDNCTNQWVNLEPARYDRLFEMCMTKAAEARKGRDYTTNDDEDFDEVVEACRFSASQATTQVWVCVPNNRADAATGEVSQ